MLDFIIGMLVGIIFGAVIMATMAVSGNCSKIEEAYHKGFDDGKASKND